MDDERLLTPAETAAILRVSKTTLTGWRFHRRQDLPAVKLGRLIRYRESDVRAFVDRHVQRPVTEATAAEGGES